jgi:hypothetical protein
MEPRDILDPSMMISRLAVACLLIAVPAAAQSRVYTNADLGKPRTWSRTATAEQLASLAAHQFVAAPVIPDGPTVTIIPGEASHGPFGPLEQAPGRPLDPFWQGNSWYGPGFAAGGWFGGGARSRKVFGADDAALRGGGRFNQGNATHLPRRPEQRPPSAAPLPRPERPRSSPGTGGGIVVRRPGH